VRRFGSACVALLFCLLPGLRSAAAANLTVCGTLTLQRTLEEVVSQYQTESGRAVDLYFADTPSLQQHIETGGHCDVAILPTSNMMLLAATGTVFGSSAIEFARSRMGIVIKAGAPRPSIDTAEKLRALFIGAKSVAYSRDEPGGEQLLLLLEGLGAAEEVAYKLVGVPGTDGAIDQAIAGGRAEIGVQLISDVQASLGVELLSAWPSEVQRNIGFAGAISRKSTESVPARDLLAYISSPKPAEIYRRHGLDPATPE